MPTDADEVMLTRLNSTDLTNLFVQHSCQMIFQQLNFENNYSEEKWKLKIVFARAFQPVCTILRKF